MVKHKHKRHIVHELKIPEAVEKTASNKLRSNVIDETIDSLLDTLNSKINKHDMTFEEALLATDMLRFNIISTYVDFRILSLTETKKPGSPGVA